MPIIPTTEEIQALADEVDALLMNAPVDQVHRAQLEAQQGVLQWVLGVYGKPELV